MTNTLQQMPFLREQRQFPNDDLRALSNQVDHAYIDIASKVNSRIISTFAIDIPVVTGEDWFITGQPVQQQTLRQVYTFTGPGPIILPHGIDTSTITGFSRIYGTFTDGSVYYSLPYTDQTLVTNQVRLVVSNANYFVEGGATAPVIVSGFVVLEWISQF